jgi:hypothetical protein
MVFLFGCSHHVPKKRFALRQQRAQTEAEMARIITNRAELKRRRELMAAAIDRARATRLAATVAAAALNAAAAKLMKPMPKSTFTAWIREHGPANQMTLVSNDEFNSSGRRVWVIPCGACDIRVR